MAEGNNNKHFFKDMKKELKKVIWPTKQQTVKNTLAVIAIVLLVAVIVILLDEVFIVGNNFVVDKVTGGQISETRNMSKALKQLGKLYKQGLIDDNTYQSLYIQAAYGIIDNATLQETINQIKNGTYNTEVPVEQSSEETIEQETQTSDSQQ